MEGDNSPTKLFAAFELSSRVAGAAALALGLLVLLGWCFGIEMLTNPAHQQAMMPNTALCFVLVGAALVVADQRAAPSRRAMRIVLSCLASLLALLNLAEYLWRNLGIDQLLFRETYSPYTSPGRMAFLTAVSFVLLGLAVALLDVGAKLGRPSEWLASLALIPALAGATDYAVDWRPDFTGIAVHTVAGLLLLCLGVLAARPAVGWMRTISSEHGGGAAARRLLPFAILVPLVVASLRWAGYQAGMYRLEFGVAITASSTVILLILAVWWNARQLNRLEERRLTEARRADEELRHVNRALHAMHACGQALVRATSETELLQEICRVVVEEGGYRTAWVGYKEDDANKTVRFVAHCGISEQYARAANITWADSERGRGPTGTAIRTGKVQSCDDVVTERRMAPWRENALAQGFRSTAVFPLMQAGTAFGALSIYSAQPHAFHAEEMRLLGRLADDLAYGIVALRARAQREIAEEAAARAARYARNLIEASLDPLVTISKSGRIMDVNHATELVTGYDRERLIGSDFSDYFTEPQKAREGYLQVFAEGTVRDYPLSIRHLSGPVTDVVYNAALYRNADGEIEGVFAAARDITERKRAEEALVARTAELERSNRELQDFASIASHDLQEPLRKVQAFGDRLREHSASALDDTSRDYLRRMQNAAERMSSLIEALLEYSRVTTKARPFERVDLNRVAAEVLADLETRIQQSAADVEIGTLPTVVADSLQIRQLLQNLLANALKFHAPDKPPFVRVSSMRAPTGGWSIVVEDHGVGFDEAYAGRIFRPFQRLHGRNEFEGSGMGLAICRKIVERHGGEISARSRPGEGSVFTVTLPANAKEEEDYATVEAAHHPDRRG